MPPWPLCKTHTLPISETINKMIDGHSGRLHERVDDNGPHEAEPSSHQVLAHHLCFRAPQWNTSWILEFVDHWYIAHIFPHIAAERSTFSYNLATCKSSFNIYIHILSKLFDSTVLVVQQTTRVTHV